MATIYGNRIRRRGAGSDELGVSRILECTEWSPGPTRSDVYFYGCFAAFSGSIEMRRLQQELKLSSRQ